MDITQNLLLIAFLIFLEGILSIDNAVVLALMAKRLPAHQQKRALSYGLLGAAVFRLLALLALAYLIRWRWIKFIGGAYLVFVSVQHLRSGSSHEKIQAKKQDGFWKTVLKIELLDIAFAIDSTLAAVAITPKIWIVFIGMMLGVVVVRFAASIFLKLIQIFPSFEVSAYIMVFLIGIKIILDGVHIEGVEFDSPSNPAFWCFWGALGLSLLYGFKRKPSAAKNAGSGNKPRTHSPSRGHSPRE